MANIVADTSAILALISPTDQFHLQASEVYRDLLHQGDRILINSYVLAEAASLIHRRLGFDYLQSFIRSIYGGWETRWIDRIAHDEIWSRMESRGGARLSLVDWSVIVTAESTRSAIFTFDSDFALEGLTVIPGQISV